MTSEKNAEGRGNVGVRMFIKKKVTPICHYKASSCTDEITVPFGDIHMESTALTLTFSKSCGLISCK